MELDQSLIKPVLHPDIEDFHFFLAQLRDFRAIEIDKSKRSAWNYFSKIDFSLLFCEMLEGLVNITKFFADHVESVVNPLLPGHPIFLASFLRRS